MTTINNLPGAPTVADDDLLVVYRTSNRRTRNVPVKDFVDYVVLGETVQSVDGMVGHVTLSYVDGPGSSINDDIAQFSGTTGKIIKDSGLKTQSSATDATAGRVMLVGAGGLMGDAPLAQNANNVTVTQFNNVTAGTLNIPVAETGMLTSVIDGGNGSQFYQSAISGVLYKRSKFAGAWGAWGKLSVEDTAARFSNELQKYDSRRGFVAGGTVTIDPAAFGGTAVWWTANGIIAFNTANIPNGYSVVCNVTILGTDTFTTTWPAAVQWPDGIVPARTGTCVYTFKFDKDSGGNLAIYGFQLGKGMATA